MGEKKSRWLKSCICTQKQLESEVFQDWAVRFGERQGRLHRKIWEWCFIAQALYERQLLAPGMSGLGFAVGTEPLASLFCSLGSSICATDLSLEIAKKEGWVDTNQHAVSLDSLNSRNLCPHEQFIETCKFRYVDMNNIPDDLKNFDFLWSSCALEHLGSLQNGENFIYNAMKCLKPGGIAVHTTEYNCSSNSETISEGSVVLYRRQDIKNIVRKLRKSGHKISVDFSPGSLPNDIYIDVPPYKQDPHLKLQLGEYTITSIGLIIKKAESSSPGKFGFLRRFKS
jgi:2-polyprenyl-3-methyl-5-hydroxy-6-metoxy-1,4-benzoquinol methylase